MITNQYFTIYRVPLAPNRNGTKSSPDNPSVSACTVKFSSTMIPRESVIVKIRRVKNCQQFTYFVHLFSIGNHKSHNF